MHKRKLIAFSSGSKALRSFMLLIVLVTFVSASAQKLGKPEVITGQLIKVVPSLKNFRADPNFKAPVTRDLTGLLVKKTAQFNMEDQGSKASGDPVVQRGTSQQQRSEQGDQEILPDVSTAVSNFDGLGFSNVAPADPTLTAGPNHVIQMINGQSGS